MFLKTPCEPEQREASWWCRPLNHWAWLVLPHPIPDRSTFSALVLVVTVVSTASSFVKPTANAYALNCFGLHLLYVLAVEMRRYRNLSLVPPVSASVVFEVKVSALQLHWREGSATSQVFRGAMGARHRLLDQWPVWLQLLAEVELLLLTRLLVGLDQPGLFLFYSFSPLLWISWTFWSCRCLFSCIFQAHSDCHCCGLRQHIDRLPGRKLRDTVLAAWTPILALW